jgi:DME family drug/metabolite transporter
MGSAAPRDLGLMLVIGLLIAADQALYFLAISLTGVTVATLITICAAPILVTLLTSMIERKRPTAFTLGIVLLALIGTVMLDGGSERGTKTDSPGLGVILAVGCACAYAGVILLGRFLAGKYHSLQITAIGFSTSAICLLVVSEAAGFVGKYPVNGWLVILYMGAVPTALAYGLFLRGMRTTPAPIASVIVLLEPLTASALAWLLFGERLTLVGILGAVVLLGAIYALSRAEVA